MKLRSVILVGLSLVILPLLGSVQGCGQSGPLVLPRPPSLPAERTEARPTNDPRGSSPTTSGASANPSPPTEPKR